MQSSYKHYERSFERHETEDMKEDESHMKEHDVTLQESRERLKAARIQLNFTIYQVWRLVEAGKFDISEATVRRFFSDDDITPTQHTIDVLSSILYSTNRDGFDPSQAQRYFAECAELKISVAELRREVESKEKQCENLAARLKAYEDAVGFYRKQLDRLLTLFVGDIGGKKDER